MVTDIILIVMLRPIIFLIQIGENDNFYKSVTVKAKTATIADGLSTLFAKNEKFIQIINILKHRSHHI